MKIDPDRPVTITLPFEMVERLRQAKQILSMFNDEKDVRAVMDIIDAIYEGALEYIREEEGEIDEYLSGDDYGGYIDPDDNEKGGMGKN